MPHHSGLGSLGKRDFVEADLDTAFALLFAAEMFAGEVQNAAQDHSDALRAIDEAEKAIGDGEQRLPGLDCADREFLRIRLERMRRLIEGIRLNLR
jgi:hypothetical protein